MHKNLKTCVYSQAVWPVMGVMVLWFAGFAVDRKVLGSIPGHSVKNREKLPFGVSALRKKEWRIKN